MTVGLDDFAQSSIHALDGIRRIDDAPYRWREGKEGNHVWPGTASTSDDGRELLAPGALLENIQFGFSRLGARCPVDRPNCGRQGLALLPTSEVETAADQMHDAGLQRRHGIVIWVCTPASGMRNDS